MAGANHYCTANLGMKSHRPCVEHHSPRFREEYFGVWGPSAWPLAGSSRWRQAPLQHMVVICSNRRIAVVVAMSGTRRKSNSSGSRSRSSGSISSLIVLFSIYLVVMVGALGSMEAKEEAFTAFIV